MKTPFDGHLHLRNGAMMETVLPDSIRTYWGGIIMPNLKPAVTTVDMAMKYRHEIFQALAKLGIDEFCPMMTLYVTEDMDPKEIEKAKKFSEIVGIKVYPKGGTTNAQGGVSDFRKILEILRAAEVNEMPVLIHGEKADLACDPWKRESKFIREQLDHLLNKFPDLWLTMEHISTKDAAMIVKMSGERVAATITPHHLYYNRSSMIQRVSGLDLDLYKFNPEKYPLPSADKIKPDPHSDCMPVLKADKHRRELIKTVVDDESEDIFAGTDSAPHAQHKKESGAGECGAYVSGQSVAMYARIFDHYRVKENGKLEVGENFLDDPQTQKRLEKFMSINGPSHYSMPQGSADLTVAPGYLRKIEISREEDDVPMSVGEGENCVVPLLRGVKLPFKIKKVA